MIIMLCIPGWRFTFQVPFTQFVEQIVPDSKGVNCLNRILRPPRKCSSMCERVYRNSTGNRILSPVQWRQIDQHHYVTR